MGVLPPLDFSRFQATSLSRRDSNGRSTNNKKFNSTFALRVVLKQPALLDSRPNLQKNHPLQPITAWPSRTPSNQHQPFDS